MNGDLLCHRIFTLYNIFSWQIYNDSRFELHNNKSLTYWTPSSLEIFFQENLIKFNFNAYNNQPYEFKIFSVAPMLA